MSNKSDFARVSMCEVSSQKYPMNHEFAQGNLSAFSRREPHLSNPEDFSLRVRKIFPLPRDHIVILNDEGISLGTLLS